MDFDRFMQVPLPLNRLVRTLLCFHSTPPCTNPLLSISKIHAIAPLYQPQHTFGLSDSRYRLGQPTDGAVSSTLSPGCLVNLALILLLTATTTNHFISNTTLNTTGLSALT